MRSIVVVAFGDEAGDHEARGRAQVGRHHVGARQLGHARDDRGVAFDLDVGAEPPQLLHVHHPVLEDRLGDHRRAVGARRERHELRLHVGREPGMRRRAHVRRDERPAAPTRMTSPSTAMTAPASRSLSITASSASGCVPVTAARPAGCGHRRQERPGLDAVGHDRVRGAVQRAHALDGDAVGAGAADARAHRDEAAREVDDLRLARGVLEHRGAVRERRRHQQVLGAGDGRHVEHEPRAVEPPGAR